MRYLLVREEEIAGQTDTAYKPRVPDGRIILAENEAKGLDNFSAQFLSAEALKVLMEQPAPDTGGGGQPSGTQPEETGQETIQEETITLIE